MKKCYPAKPSVVGVPFGKQVNLWEASIDGLNLPYKAVLRLDLPYVDFVFDERLPETKIDQLSEKYGDWCTKAPMSLSGQKL